MCLQCIQETVEDNVTLDATQTYFMYKFNPRGAETVGCGKVE